MWSEGTRWYFRQIYYLVFPQVIHISLVCLSEWILVTFCMKSLLWFIKYSSFSRNWQHSVCVIWVDNNRSRFISHMMCAKAERLDANDTHGNGRFYPLALLFCIPYASLAVLVNVYTTCLLEWNWLIGYLILIIAGSVLRFSTILVY